MKRCVIVLLLAAMIVSGSGPLNASSGLALQVSPSVSMAPADVRVRARVERDAENRGMEIAADSGEFFRSSFIALEGDKAPSVTELAFKGLPGGEYQVTVVLIGSRGVRATASRTVRIVASAVE